MSGLWKMITGAGAIIAAVAGFFFYAKGKGKEEARNEANRQIIDNIEKRHKIDVDVDRIPSHELDNELLDDDTNK